MLRGDFERPARQVLNTFVVVYTGNAIVGFVVVYRKALVIDNCWHSSS